jgi:hypothetical protein
MIGRLCSSVAALHGWEGLGHTNGVLHQKMPQSVQVRSFRKTKEKVRQKTSPEGYGVVFVLKHSQRGSIILPESRVTWKSSSK